MFGRGSALMKSDEEWCRMIQYSSYLTKCREGSPQLPHASSRKCPVCGIEKPLTVDNFQIVPSFQKGFSYYCNDCDPESRKQKTITPEEFNLFLKMKRKRRWEAKFVILSWFYFLFILSSRYGLIPQAAGSAWVARRGSLTQSDAVGLIANDTPKGVTLLKFYNYFVHSCSTGRVPNIHCIWCWLMVDESKDFISVEPNSKDFSGRIDVEVPEEVLAHLQRISDRTGQSISEIAAAMVIEGAERFD